MKKIKSKISKNIKLLKFYFLYFNKITFKNKTKGRKEIIIVFDGNFPHGGLVDRLKGILSFYQVAKKTDADFKIYFKNATIGANSEIIEEVKVISKRKSVLC